MKNLFFGCEGLESMLTVTTEQALDVLWHNTNKREFWHPRFSEYKNFQLAAIDNGFMVVGMW